MNNSVVPSNHLDDALRPFLDQLERDFNVLISYSCRSEYPYASGCHLDFTFSGEALSRTGEEFERRTQEAMKLLDIWGLHYRASLPPPD